MLAVRLVLVLTSTQRCYGAATQLSHCKVLHGDDTRFALLCAACMTFRLSLYERVTRMGQCYINSRWWRSRAVVTYTVTAMIADTTNWDIIRVPMDINPTSVRTPSYRVTTSLGRGSCVMSQMSLGCRPKKSGDTQDSIQ